MSIAKKHSWFAAKVQSTFDTPIAVSATTDYMPFVECDIEINHQSEKVSICSGRFTSEDIVLGARNATVKGKVALSSLSKSVKPKALDLILECACFGSTETTTTDGKKWAYTRQETSKDFSMNYYIWADGKAKCFHVNSVIINSLKITLDGKKVAYVEFSGVCKVGGTDGTNAIDFVTEETIASDARPSIVHDTFLPISIETQTFASTAYEFYKTTIDLTNKITQQPTLSGDGFGKAKVTDQESKWTLSTILDENKVHPYTYFQSKTKGALEIVSGAVADQQITISCSKALIRDCPKDAEQSDLLACEFSGDFQDNELVITINSDQTAA
jgi:hypothetical protein